MGAHKGFKKGLSGNPSGEGGFTKGKSGNPGGRPKKDHEAAARVAELARKHCPRAIGILVDIMKHGEKEATRLAAAMAILDRGIGKPLQTMDVDSDGPLVVIVREE